MKGGNNMDFLAKHWKEGGFRRCFVGSLLLISSGAPALSGSVHNSEFDAKWLFPL